MEKYWINWRFNLSSVDKAEFVLYISYSSMDGVGDFTETIPFLGEMFMLLGINFAFKYVKTTPWELLQSCICIPEGLL